MADGEDRTEQASARRLERARGEGNVPVSRELSALVVLGATAMILAMAAPGLAASLGRRMMLFISDAHRLDPAAGLRMAAVAVVACAAPFVLASLFSGSAAVLLQTGFCPSQPQARPVTHRQHQRAARRGKIRRQDRHRRLGRLARSVGDAARPAPVHVVDTSDAGRSRLA
jgi:flagellar biosynthesis protein FlhB